MKRKSLFRSTLIRLLVILLCLWLLGMAVLTAALAGDVQRQAQPVFAAALEKSWRGRERITRSWGTK